ncbi:MAG: hypothetical protein ACYTE0_08115 [Planctomycetota bacterium]|jgi:hypothetical protein
MGVNGKSLIEIVSISVLAGGLILVAYQINQATNIADAEIRAEGTSRWRAVDGTRQGEMFAAALAKSYEDPAALTLAEMIELDAYYMGVIDQMSSAYRMTSSGYRDDPIEGYLSQGALTYFGNAYAKVWWKQYRKLLVGDDPGFVVLFDEAVAAVSDSQNLDSYLAINKELASADEATTLQTIMQGLRDDLVEISNGLLTDDFELVDRGASAITNHPHIPPAQVQLVAKELGQEMPAFKQFDTRVHELSVQISTAANGGDRAAAISGFREMVDGCLACHASYKDRVAAVLRDPG